MRVRNLVAKPPWIDRNDKRLVFRNNLLLQPAGVLPLLF